MLNRAATKAALTRTGLAGAVMAGALALAAAPPSSGVSWPTLQLSHSVAPGVDANVFVSHLEHSARPSMLLARPGMHGRHAARPVAFWCVPAAQGVHRLALSSSPART